MRCLGELVPAGPVDRRPGRIPQYVNPHLGVLRNGTAGLRMKSMKTPKTLTHGSTFGPFSRYMLVRHESHRGPEFSMWFVLDAERVDDVTGGPAVIRQEATIEAAVAGLLAESDPGFYDQAAEGEVEENDLAVELDDDFDRMYGEGDFPVFDAAGDELEGVSL